MINSKIVKRRSSHCGATSPAVRSAEKRNIKYSSSRGLETIRKYYQLPKKSDIKAALHSGRNEEEMVWHEVRC